MLKNKQTLWYGMDPNTIFVFVISLLSYSLCP